MKSRPFIYVVIAMLSLLVGLIHALPDLWFRIDLGDRYAFSMVNAMPDEEAYRVKIRGEIVGGSYSMTSAIR